MGELVGDVLPVAVRVWTTRDTSNGEDGTWEPVPARVRERRYPAEALVFDTETRDEASQRLLVGVWRFYRDDPDTGHHGETCIEEGFFYPDDLPERDPAGWQHLREYVAANRADDVAAGFPRQVQLRPLSWWLEHRLYRYGVRHRNRCAIVGFNLPFDFGALAQHWSPARGRYRGGWSLGLWGEFDDTGTWHDRRYHPRLKLKAIDPRRTLFGWGTTGTEGQPSQDDADMRGHRRFVDLRTLTFALTDGSHTLETACAAFGNDYTKPKVTYGVINPDMLRYARQDVAHTAQLYRNCYTELGRHPGIDLQPHALYSPAGVGAAYLKAMNLTPPLGKFKKDLDPRLLGWTMSAFFGGRAEARIVRTPVPVVVADFTSMYPAINALLNTWPILTAERVTVDDVTRQVRSLVDDLQLVDRLFDPARWGDDIGTTLVQLDNPDGVILPIRASFDPKSPDFGIGVNPLTYEGCPWYALPDVLAAAILGDAPIRIARALRLTPHGRQPNLRPVQLRGTKPVDPRQETNPFVAMIEERHRVKHAADIDPTEAERL
nr:hypothetical protein [Actinomycetota bacterium]